MNVGLGSTQASRWYGLLNLRHHAHRYLYKSNSPGVQDYLCNRLYTLPEAGLEKYLSQMCQLVITRPYGLLEKVIVDLCAKSLRIAVKARFTVLPWHGTLHADTACAMAGPPLCTSSACEATAKSGCR